MLSPSQKTRTAWIAGLVVLLGSLLWFLVCRAKPKENAIEAEHWVLKDSITSNLSSMDPISIVDALTITVLGNVYQGLVGMDSKGRIIPALAEKWEVSPDRLVWRFQLKRGVAFHPAHGCSFSLPAELTASDVAYSLIRTIRNPRSLYGWAFGDLVAGAGVADSVAPISGIRVLSPHQLEIHLVQPFALLNRLATVGGWIYPRNIVEQCGEDYLSHQEVGTGLYTVKRYVPDDRLELSRFSGYGSSAPAGAPDEVHVFVQPDPLAALEAFKADKLDVVEVQLETLASARRLEEEGRGKLLVVDANHLDYLVMNNRKPPYDDVRVRRAINLAIDRRELVGLLSGIARPAFGFVPPVSPAYRGEAATAARGFAFDPDTARALLQEYLGTKEPRSLKLDLLIDNGEIPETTGQYVQSSLQKNLGIEVRLVKKTWPEVLTAAFTGGQAFYRFWWNVVTPGDDVYFLFVMPGKEPPTGFNVSYYANPTFPAEFLAAFGMADPQARLARIHALEDRLISDAVAVPLFHRQMVFFEKPGIAVAINPYLQRPYQDARRTAAAAR